MDLTLFDAKVSFGKRSLPANNTNPTTKSIHVEKFFSPDMISIYLPERSNIGDLETFISNFFRSNPKADKNNWNLDFSDCEFIEVASLIYLVSLINSQVRRGYSFNICLPKKEKVTDFLIVWDFFECLEKTTGVELSKFISSKDIIYYEERRKSPDLNYSDFRILSGKEVRLLSKNFFSLNVFDLDSSSDNRLTIQNCSDNWQQNNITSVLEKHLKVPGAANEFSSRVVFEAVANATLHPKANYVLTASRFEGNNFNKQFTWIIWDDGDNIVKTLKDGIKDNKTGNVLEPLFRKRRRYNYTIVDENGKNIDKSSIRADFDKFDAETPDHILFIASTFLGVTREKVLSKSKENNKTKESNFSRGTGLYYLTNFALDSCGGSVAFRINNFFMNVKSSKRKKQQNSNNDKEVEYDVKIIKYNDHLPAFLGNMLTIRLPLAKF